MRKTLIALFFIGMLGVFLIPLQSSATTASDLQQQINTTNTQIQALDKEIQQYQAQIDQTDTQSNTLTNLIKELTLTRNKLLLEQSQTQVKIHQTGALLTELETNIDAEQKIIAVEKTSLAKMLNELYQHDQTGFVEQILSASNFTDASRQYNDIISFNKDIDAHMMDLNNQVASLNSSVVQKQTEQSNLTQLNNTLKQKALAVTAAKSAKDALLSETKNSEANYKKLLADRQQKRDAFEKSLSDYESQLKFILNPSLLPEAGSSALAWPLDKIYVTQLFGKTVAGARLYASGSHSGVDFRAPIGTPVKSMGVGTVIGTGNTDLYCQGASFGNWVFIRYNNGLSSTYGHLSVIEATPGQKVQTGDIVGLSGNTGHSTGPHLHVTVYASEGADVKTVPSLSCSGKTFIMPIAPTKAYLDPMLYLPPLPAGALKPDIPRD